MANTTMIEKDMGQVAKRQAVIRIIVKVFVYFFLILMALIVLFPFYWMIISSLKSLDEYKATIPTLFPKHILFANYVEAFQKAELGTLFMNTLYVGLVSTILSLIITVLSAFAFARLEFKGKNILFAGLLATMMIPPQVNIIPLFYVMKQLHWIDTFQALILPGLFGGFGIVISKYCPSKGSIYFFFIL